MSDVNYNITWDESGKHFYETGVDHGVLYLQDSNGAYPKGEAWNGLSAVTQSPSGAEANPIYADNIKYLNLFSVEDFGGTIEAYYYPDGFEKCNGRREIVEGSGVYVSMQERATFGLTYRTKLGNDVEGDDYAYKLHIVYGAKASPSEMNYQTTNDSPEPIAMSWEFSTIPVNVPGFKPTAYIELSAKDVDADKLAALETILYGTAAEGQTAAVEGRLPLPEEIIDLLD